MTEEQEAAIERGEKAEGMYGGFFVELDCMDCGNPTRVEGDVSSGEEYECEGCGITLVVVNR